MSRRRPVPKLPGGPPREEQRALYLDLVSNGVNNSRACLIVGVNRRTGTRWSRGRTWVAPNGRTYTYPPIAPRPAPTSDRFLSEADRVLIADGLHAGDTLTAIAKRLGRATSTISREVQRNRDPVTGRYSPRHAHRQTVQRRSRRRPGKLALHLELRALVQAGLDRRWSPEQIAHTLPVDHPDRPDLRVSPETIYQAIYARTGTELHREPVRVLRLGRSRRRPRRRPEQRLARFVEPVVLITERPAEADDRRIAGHWEGDLIMGATNRSAIATLVERTSRYLLLVHLPDRHTADQLAAGVIATMTDLPEDLRRSLTWDQGSEMAMHGDVARAIGMPVFFCAPGKPWQRGTNENTNGLLRQYFPKGSNLAVHSPSVLAAVAAELNQRPRKTLGWQTPERVLWPHLEHPLHPPLLQ